MNNTQYCAYTQPYANALYQNFNNYPYQISQEKKQKKGHFVRNSVLIGGAAGGAAGLFAANRFIKKDMNTFREFCDFTTKKLNVCINGSNNVGSFLEKIKKNPPQGKQIITILDKFGKKHNFSNRLWNFISVNTLLQKGFTLENSYAKGKSESEIFKLNEKLGKKVPKLVSGILHTAVAVPTVIVGATLGAATAAAAKFVKNRKKKSFNQ